MSDSNLQFISLSDASKYSEIYSQEYLSLRARQGKLKAEKLGRNWVTTKQWVDDYVHLEKNVKANGVIHEAKKEKIEEPAFATTKPARAKAGFVSLRRGEEYIFKFALASSIATVLIFSAFIFKDKIIKIDKTFDAKFLTVAKNISENIETSFTAVKNISENIKLPELNLSFVKQINKKVSLASADLKNSFLKQNSLAVESILNGYEKAGSYLSKSNLSLEKQRIKFLTSEYKLFTQEIFNSDIFFAIKELKKELGEGVVALAENTKKFPVTVSNIFDHIFRSIVRADKTLDTKFLSLAKSVKRELNFEIEVPRNDIKLKASNYFTGIKILTKEYSELAKTNLVLAEQLADNYLFGVNILAKETGGSAKEFARSFVGDIKMVVINSQETTNEKADLAFVNLKNSLSNQNDLTVLGIVGGGKKIGLAVVDLKDSFIQQNDLTALGIVNAVGKVKYSITNSYEIASEGFFGAVSLVEERSNLLAEIASNISVKDYLALEKQDFVLDIKDYKLSTIETIKEISKEISSSALATASNIKNNIQDGLAIAKQKTRNLFTNIKALTIYIVENVQKGFYFVIRPWLEKYQALVILSGTKDLSKSDSSALPQNDKSVVQKITQITQITQIQPVKEITKETTRETIISKVDSQELAELKANIANLQALVNKFQYYSPSNSAPNSPVYIGSSGLEISGNAVLTSLGVSGSAGIRDLGVGNSFSVGSGSTMLTVDKYGHLTAPSITGGSISGSSLSSTGNITATGDLSVGGSTSITGNLTVGGIAVFSTSTISMTTTTASIFSIGTSTTANLFTVAGSGNIIFQNTGQVYIAPNGTTTIGASTSTPTILTGYIASDILPYYDNTYSIGSSAYKWKQGYFGDTLSVNGTSTLATTSATLLTVSGNSVLSGNLNVSGTSTLVTTTATFLSISGNGLVSGYLTVGTSTQYYPLYVSGNSYFAGNSTTTGNSQIAGNLQVVGSQTIGSTLNILATSTQATTSITQLLVSGDSILFGGLWASGTSTLATTTATFLSISGNGLVSGYLTVGTSTQYYPLYVSGNSYFAGNSTTTGNSQIAGNFAVNGKVNSDLIPDENATRDLGSTDYYWGYTYVDHLVANNISAASTTVGGTQSESFTLNSDNNSVDTQSQSLIFFRGQVVPNAVLTWDAGADKFDFNQSVFMQNDSSTTTVPSLEVWGSLGQTADFFRIASSSGAVVFNVASSSDVGIAGNVNIAGNITVGGTYNILSTSTQATTSIAQLLISGNSILSGGLWVSGTSTLATTTATFLIVSGNATTSGNYVIGGNLNIGGSLYASAANLTNIPATTTFGIISAGTWQGTAIADGYIASAAKWNAGIATTTFNSITDLGTLGVSGTTTLATTSISLLTVSLNGTVAGNFGIGTTTPSSKLSISGTAGSKLLDIGFSTGTSTLSINGSGLLTFSLGDNSSISMSIQEGTNAYLTFDTSNDAEKIVVGKNLETGTMNIDADSGAVNFANMDITSTSVTSTVNSLSIALDGNAVLTVYGESTGHSGMLQNMKVGIGTTTPIAMLSIAGNAYSTGPLLRISTSTKEALFISEAGLVAIGTTTPIALLSVRGGTSASAPLFRVGTTSMEAMYIDSTGKIGIGTTSPYASFDLLGIAGVRPFRISTSTGNTMFTVMQNGNVGVATSTPYTTFDLLGVAGYDSFRISSSTGSTLFTVLQNGNVGVATTTAGFTLTNAGTFYSTGATYLGSSLNVSATSSLATTTATYLTVSGNGIFNNRVGIGTSTPYYTLDISSQTGVGSFRIASSSVYNALLIDNNGLMTFGLADNSSTSMSIQEGTNAYLTFDTSNDAEKMVAGKDLEIGTMRIDQDSGAVQFANMNITASSTVGTVESLSIALDGVSVLTVYGEADGAGYLQNYRVGIGTTTPISMLTIIGSASSSASSLLKIATSTVNAMFIDGMGNVGIGTTSPNTFMLEVAGNVGPSANSTYNLGSDTRRWATFYASTTYAQYINVGDLIFSNNFRFIEAPASSTKQALYLSNQNNDKLFTITDDGSIEIGTPEKPAGITLYDEDTHEPYCLKMKAGAMISQSGKCGEISSDAGVNGTELLPSSGGSNSVPSEPVPVPQVAGDSTTTEPEVSSFEPTVDPPAEVIIEPTIEPEPASALEPIIEAPAEQPAPEIPAE